MMSFYRSALFFLVFGLQTSMVSAQNAVPSGGKLPTKWDSSVSATAPWPEYPRPQLTRSNWQNLNGQWDYALTDPEVTTPPTAYTGKILVPYPYESALSGVAGGSIPKNRLWYHRTFTVPASWSGKTVLLHFGAVNYDSTTSVNGGPAQEHVGGYTSFTYDITGELKPGVNDIVVSVWNPLRSDTANAQVLGKQRAHPGGIFYTSATGIWQTVWLEPVSQIAISAIHIVPDVDSGSVHVSADTTNAAGASLKVTILDGSKNIASITGPCDGTLSIVLPHPHLWSPSDPFLYNVRVSLLSGNKTVDDAGSYFGLRKISVGPDANGVQRLLLNNKFLPEIGLLDQGYWPDGIYTAPTDDALAYDIKEAKLLGFNLLRKHAKVEPDRWYYDADRVGMLVWQDMPQAFGGPGGALTDDSKTQFHTELLSEIKEFWNHPSIIVWTTFNEGWGQHDTPDIVADVQQLDPTRLVNNASGWTDEKVGDISDTHAYPGPWSAQASEQSPRAVVNGEFGGITERIPGHMWTTDVFGYGSTLSGGWLVTRKYQDLLKAAYGLIQSRGTSAFVYTQLTDVEQESNGILTYDRAIVKPIASIITAANQGLFLPLPPNPDQPIVPTAVDVPDKLIWKYTTTENPAAANWYAVDFDDSSWKSGQSPFGQGYGGANTPWTDSPGDIWIRRTVTIPASLPDKLDFRVFHDEGVDIYVNGVLAATASGFVTDYANIPINDAGRAAIKPGQPNLVAAHCHNTVGAQYLDIGIIKAN